LKINFFTEGVSFNVKGKIDIRKWMHFVIKMHSKNLGEINFILSSDDYILKINQDFLSHNYFTDIITFNYNEGISLSGDIFISIDTVRKNAEIYKVSFENELLRVMIHGILHLIGFDDRSMVDRDVMRNEENRCLDIYYSKSFLK
jgi:metalloprotein, YbeY/UPF0054 family